MYEIYEYIKDYFFEMDWLHVKNITASAQKAFLRGEYVFLDYTKMVPARAPQCFFIWFGFLNNIMPCPFSEINCHPATVKLKFIAKRKLAYLNDLTRLPHLPWFSFLIFPIPYVFGPFCSLPSFLLLFNSHRPAFNHHEPCLTIGRQWWVQHRQTPTQPGLQWAAPRR